MSQAQLTFIEKIKGWFNKLLKKEEEIMIQVEAVVDQAEAMVEVVEKVNPKAAKKIKDASKTIDETIAKVRGTNVTVKKVADKVEVLATTAVQVSDSFKKGRFDATEIATISNAIAMAGTLEVDWNTLSANLNRDIKSIKAKAKLITK
jgi:hypothetical protein